MKVKPETEHVDFSQYPEMVKTVLVCLQCEEVYRPYDMKHWYDDDMCESCNEDHSTNDCKFCGESLVGEGYHCSRECAKADNTEGV